MSELNLVLLGPPGAGKGTQAERLQEDFRLPYYATGNILRDAVDKGTDLGKKAEPIMNAGDLVPDELMIGIIQERLNGEEAQDGFILDGFPRTVGQAEALESALDELGRSLTAVLAIDVPDEEIIRRLSGRRQCKNGHVYHVEFNKPKHDDVCDIDGLKLFQRDDDKPETIRNRLETYHEKTSPLIDFYDERGILKRFDGSRSPTEVHDHIRATLATLRLEEQI
jgi:adenylate kinase